MGLGPQGIEIHAIFFSGNAGAAVSVGVGKVCARQLPELPIVSVMLMTKYYT